MRSKYNNVIESAVQGSKSWAEVCRKLGLKPNTGSQTYIKKVAIDKKINIKHFTGQGWNKGKKFPPKFPIEKYLKKGKPVVTDRLKKRLFKEHIKKKKCEECGISTWMGKELPLELDHKNGDRFDNRLFNLQILCPNCHSIKTRKDRKQTPVS